MLSDIVAGASSNALDIIKLRKAYNDYVEGGGTMTFPEFAKQYGVNQNPYKNNKS